MINAGGAGTRMGGERPKPLVPVRGLPLVERNLLAARGAGATDVVVVVPAAAAALHGWAEGRAARLCAAVGARLQVAVEAVPRGTGACLALARPFDRPVLLLYADNLTGLDLLAFDRHHAATGADATLAVHEERFVVPFGQVRTSGGRVTDYNEKPALPVTISSGAYLFHRAALAEIPADGRFDVPDLVRARLARGEDVRPFAHEAPWIDVNDPAAAGRAEALVGRHPALERFVRTDAPVREVAGVVLRRGTEVLLEWRPPRADLYPAVWDTPGGKLEPGETPQAAAARELDEELGLRDLPLEPLAVLDDLEPGRGWVRHHVFQAALEGRTFRAREAQRLAFHPAAAPRPDWAVPALRSLCWLSDAAAP